MKKLSKEDLGWKWSRRVMYIYRYIHSRWPFVHGLVNTKISNRVVFTIALITELGWSRGSIEKASIRDITP